VGRALGSHSSQPALPIGVFEGFESIYFLGSCICRFADLAIWRSACGLMIVVGEWVRAISRLSVCGSEHVVFLMTTRAD
jgi:hypothetical protein